MNGYAELQQLVEQVTYKPGWSFTLARGSTFSTSVAATTADRITGTSTSGGYAWFDAELATLLIEIVTADSGEPSRPVRLQHRFTAPPAFCGSWRRWLIEQILAVERHEACEFFRIGDQRPFFPHHGPGGDLYAVRERS